MCTSLTLGGSETVITRPNKLHPRASAALLTSQGMMPLGSLCLSTQSECSSNQYTPLAPPHSSNTPTSLHFSPFNSMSPLRENQLKSSVSSLVVSPPFLPLGLLLSPHHLSLPSIFSCRFLSGLNGA